MDLTKFKFDPKIGKMTDQKSQPFAFNFDKFEKMIEETKLNENEFLEPKTKIGQLFLNDMLKFVPTI